MNRYLRQAIARYEAHCHDLRTPAFNLRGVLAHIPPADKQELCLRGLLSTDTSREVRALLLRNVRGSSYRRWRLSTDQQMIDWFDDMASFVQRGYDYSFFRAYHYSMYRFLLRNKKHQKLFFGRIVRANIPYVRFELGDLLDTEVFFQLQQSLRPFLMGHEDLMDVAQTLIHLLSGRGNWFVDEKVHIIRGQNLTDARIDSLLIMLTHEHPMLWAAAKRYILFKQGLPLKEITASEVDTSALPVLDTRPRAHQMLSFTQHRADSEVPRRKKRKIRAKIS